MAINLPPEYAPVQKKLDELARTNPIKSALDLGCGPNGRYVGWLLDQGYDAWGVDAKCSPSYSSTLSPRVSERLYAGELTDLRQIFGKRAFDLMTSHAVL